MFYVNFGLFLLAIAAWQIKMTLSANLYVATKGNLAYNNNTRKPDPPLAGNNQTKDMNLFGFKRQELPKLSTELLQMTANTKAANSTDTGSITVKPDSSTTSQESPDYKVSIPNFKKDHKGNWVYQIWGVTFGNVWQDTRFRMYKAVTLERIKVDSEAIMAYYPLGTLGTACVGKTTIYNFPKVKDYLHQVKRAEEHKHRPIWKELRRQIYLQGRSEECHTKEFKHWRTFVECQLRRNMRMEYLIPKYPLHQLQ